MKIYTFLILIFKHYELTSLSFSSFFLTFVTFLSAIPCVPFIEVKGGYFIFADQKMRSVYRDGGWDVQVSCSFPLKPCLQLYTSIEYLQAEGHSLDFHEKTRLWQVPVTVGIRGYLQISNAISYYATIGRY